MAQIITQTNAVISQEDVDLAGKYVFSAFGGGRGSENMHKLRQVYSIRDQIAGSMGACDPELAITFITITSAMASIPDIVDGLQKSDVRLLSRLAVTMAKRDPSKALEIGLASLKKGLSEDHIALLKTLASSDKKALEKFASAIVDKVRADSDGPDIWMLRSLLTAADDNYRATASGGARYFDQMQMREIATVLAKKAVDDGYMLSLDLIERYAPASYAEMSAKMRIKGRGWSNANAAVANAMANAAARADVADAYSQSPEEKAREERQKRYQDEQKERGDAVEAVAKMDGKMSAAERQKLIDRVHAVIARSRNRAENAGYLAITAYGVNTVGDKATALELLREADGYLNPDPRNYEDFMSSWAVATAYAEIDTEQAFSRVEMIVSRLNETVNAAAKVAEFIDTRNEIIYDGEFLLGAFGGSEARSLSGMMTAFRSPVRKMGKFDLVRLKAITDRIDRPEARVFIKLFVLKALTGEDVKGSLYDISRSEEIY